MKNQNAIRAAKTLVTEALVKAKPIVIKEGKKFVIRVLTTLIEPKPGMA